MVKSRKHVVFGNPDEREISTSHVERQNLTMRMKMRRMTRLTNGFSKKVDGLEAAVALHFMHYNFSRIHQTLRTTPAIAAGIADHVWSIEESSGCLLANPRRPHSVKASKHRRAKPPTTRCDLIQIRLDLRYLQNDDARAR
jgi:hypothetical protein